ncbi:hypothetical protein BBJ29_007056 [Phytophthora kernoviae]|uniref:Glutamine cyclotransferase n=1 Tax=Phytophthora kernoviae TaxID=325452 RepID=A0A3F2RHY0_9STRA|nr:hypothetical protein BBJ29_007056 [Phytophthora kernoviae]RLN57471.1 hypothetical protein BBP00_00007488 [Phytophthora kernoviae]
MSRVLVRITVIAVMLGLVAFLVVGMSYFKTPKTLPTHNLSPAEEVRRRTAAQPTVEFLAKYPHDSAAFTQGLTLITRGNDKFLIESTGLYGESSLRRVEISSGRVLDQYNLPKELFGEGVTVGPSGEFVMLTWKNDIGLVFDLDDSSSSETGFTLKREFEFETVTGEGWGIDFDGENYAVSDGSSTIMFWDPSTMTEVRRVDVSIYNGDQKISQINELESANGFIYANVWYQPYVLKIDPKNGAVVSMFDLSRLVKDAGVDVKSGAVLNGIAYDEQEDAFYVTGKQWGAVYKIRLIDASVIASVIT